MIIGIILAIVAIICCLTAFIIDVIHSNEGSAICMLLLVFLNAYILKDNLNKLNESQEIRTTIVKDVQEFSIDSTLVINGTDTTKTYTITYLK